MPNEIAKNVISNLAKKKISKIKKFDNRIFI